MEVREKFYRMIISKWKHPKVAAAAEVAALLNSSIGSSSRDPCHPFLLPLLLLPPTTILCTAAAVIQVRILCLQPKRWTVKYHKVRRPFTNTIAHLRRRLLLRRRCRRRQNPFEELATFGMQVLAEEEEETTIIETWVAVLALVLVPVPVANTTVLGASIHRDLRPTSPRMRSRSHHCRSLEEEKDRHPLFDRTSADRRSGTETT